MMNLLGCQRRNESNLGINTALFIAVLCLNLGFSCFVQAETVLAEKLISPVQINQSVQSLAQGSCQRNSDCGNFEYCSIDTQKCVACPDCEACINDDDTTDDDTDDSTDDTTDDDNDVTSDNTDDVVCPNGEHNLEGNCVQCIAHNDCSNPKPYCNEDTHVCEVCPTDTPKWKGTSCGCPTGKYNLDGKCVQCVRQSDCEGDTNFCNALTHTCEKCPTDFPRWNGYACDCKKGDINVDGVCRSELYECLKDDDCESIDEPVCNKRLYICEPCPPENPEWNANAKKCSKKYTITFNNMGTKTTKKVFEDENVYAFTPTFSEMQFHYWAATPGGSAVTFPQKVTKDQTYYAYYRGVTVERGEWPLNACGGSRLGSEYTYTTATVSSDSQGGRIKYLYEVYLRSAWNNDGYNCGGKAGSIGWTIDGVKPDWLPTQLHCTWINTGYGNNLTFYFESSWQWAKYCDVVFRAKVRTTPTITNYPY